MSAAHPALLELIDFLAAGTTPESLIAFRPSLRVEQRISGLITAKEDGSLSPEESAELDDFLQLEHILIMAKAQARRHSSIG
jgi:hypothetical protein